MNVLLVGCGEMAVHHLNVLRALGVQPTVIGRGATSARTFSSQTHWPVAGLDLDAHLATSPPAECAIVSVSVESLSSVCIKLIQAGVKRILLEKPGALRMDDLEAVRSASRAAGAQVCVAYNRRFYDSTRLARDIIAADGGVVSCHFDFTEWSHQVDVLDRPPHVKERWLLANSSHVIDLVFHLIGPPTTLVCVTAGTLSWHPASAVFAGHGVSTTGALFSYHANWSGPGRWMCEFVTDRHKLVFQPMEELRIMVRGSVALNRVDPSDNLDQVYKPGLYRQSRDFLDGQYADMCSVDEQLAHWPLYQRIANYGA